MIYRDDDTYLQKRRLEAEIKTVGRNDLKLLAKLLQENDLEVSMGKSFHVILC